MSKNYVNLPQAFGQALKDYSFVVINKASVTVEMVIVWLVLAALATGMIALGFDATVIVLVTTVMGGLLNGWTSKARKADGREE